MGWGKHDIEGKERERKRGGIVGKGRKGGGLWEGKKGKGRGVEGKSKRRKKGAQEPHNLPLN